MKNRVKLNVPNLKSALISKGMKKQDIAAKVGISRETLSRWLSGKVEFIDENTFGLGTNNQDPLKSKIIYKRKR